MAISPRQLQPFDHRRAIEIGAAGEHIVCAHLLLSGYRAFQASQGAPYDIAVEVDGQLVRITVKSTTCPKPRPARPSSRGIYSFNVGRHKRDGSGKTSARRYLEIDVDIVALVTLDTFEIAFVCLKNCKSMMQFEAEHGSPRQNHMGKKTGQMKRLGDFTFTSAIAALRGCADAPAQ